MCFKRSLQRISKPRNVLCESPQRVPTGVCSKFSEILGASFRGIRRAFLLRVFEVPGECLRRVTSNLESKNSFPENTGSGFPEITRGNQPETEKGFFFVDDSLAKQSEDVFFCSTVGVRGGESTVAIRNRYRFLVRGVQLMHPE